MAHHRYSLSREVMHTRCKDTTAWENVHARTRRSPLRIQRSPCFYLGNTGLTFQTQTNHFLYMHKHVCKVTTYIALGEHSLKAEYLRVMSVSSSDDDESSASPVLEALGSSPVIFTITRGRSSPVVQSTNSP